MKERFRVFKESLNDVIIMNKKEMVLKLTVCVLGGILLGILFSPKKHSVIGSYNGNNSGNGSLNDGESEGCEEIKE